MTKKIKSTDATKNVFKNKIIPINFIQVKKKAVGNYNFLTPSQRP